MKNILRKVSLVMATWVLAAPALAQESAGASNEYDVKMFAYLAAGLAMGLAVLGGALGQGRMASSAFEGIARNPSAQEKIFTPMLLALALTESLVILAFVTALQLSGK